MRGVRVYFSITLGSLSKLRINLRFIASSLSGEDKHVSTKHFRDSLKAPVELLKIRGMESVSS